MYCVPGVKPRRLQCCPPIRLSPPRWHSRSRPRTTRNATTVVKVAELEGRGRRALTILHAQAGQMLHTRNMLSTLTNNVRNVIQTLWFE